MWALGAGSSALAAAFGPGDGLLPRPGRCGPQGARPAGSSGGACALPVAPEHTGHCAARPSRGQGRRATRNRPNAQKSRSVFVSCEPDCLFMHAHGLRTPGRDHRPCHTCVCGLGQTVPKVMAGPVHRALDPPGPWEPRKHTHPENHLMELLIYNVTVHTTELPEALPETTSISNDPF